MYSGRNLISLDARVWLDSRGFNNARRHRVLRLIVAAAICAPDRLVHVLVAWVRSELGIERVPNSEENKKGGARGGETLTRKALRGIIRDDGKGVRGDHFHEGVFGPVVQLVDVDADGEGAWQFYGEAWKDKIGRVPEGHGGAGGRGTGGRGAGGRDAGGRGAVGTGRLGAVGFGAGVLGAGRLGSVCPASGASGRLQVVKHVAGTGHQGATEEILLDFTAGVEEKRLGHGVGEQVGGCIGRAHVRMNDDRRGHNRPIPGSGRRLDNDGSHGKY